MYQSRVLLAPFVLHPLPGRLEPPVSVPRLPCPAHAHSFGYVFAKLLYGRERRQSMCKTIGCTIGSDLVSAMVCCVILGNTACTAYRKSKQKRTCVADDTYEAGGPVQAASAVQSVAGSARGVAGHAGSQFLPSLQSSIECTASVLPQAVGLAVVRFLKIKTTYGRPLVATMIHACNVSLPAHESPTASVNHAHAHVGSIEHG